MPPLRAVSLWPSLSQAELDDVAGKFDSIYLGSVHCSDKICLPFSGRYCSIEGLRGLVKTDNWNLVNSESKVD